jgi:pyrimidine operon attenuation protein/uracil phosphoribosyltransferase
MQSEKTQILNHDSILIRIERMACEICEKHSQSGNVWICGLNDRGYFLAALLCNKIGEILPELQCKLLRVNTKNGGVDFDGQAHFAGGHVLLVDDVINTGATVMKALLKIYEQSPASIGTAFLAKREHRYYPVKADYVGISLATTLQEHVEFNNDDPAGLKVYLV